MIDATRAAMGEVETRIRALFRERGLEPRHVTLDELVDGEVGLVLKHVGGTERIFADRWMGDGSLRSVRVHPLGADAPWDFDVLWSLNRCAHPGDGRSPGSADHVLAVVDAWLCRGVPEHELPPRQPLRGG